MSFWVLYAFSLSAVVPAAIGLFKYKSLPNYAKAVVLITSLTFLNELVTLIASFVIYNNMIVYYLYVAILSFLLARYFISILKKAEYTYFIFGSISVLSALEFLLFDNTQFNSYSFIALSLLTIFYCIKCFYALSTDTTLDGLGVNFNLVIIFQFLSNFMYLAFMRYLQATEDWSYIVTYVQVSVVTNAISYIYLTYLLWKPYKSLQSVL